MEHLDKDIVNGFLLEVKRVLRPGGIHRIVVPDFEFECRRYLNHIETCVDSEEQVLKHDDYVAKVIEQSVRKEASGTSQQKPFRRFLENLMLGDSRKRGETHQWMYDRINLKSTLESLGYSMVVVQKYNSSLIPEWDSFGLDISQDDKEYKPFSLYVEAVK